MTTTGSLVVVATPIGNLGDFAPRAMAALKACAVVLAEDTRHSRPLLDRAGFTGPLLSCHAHNEDERTADVVARISRGEQVGLVTDAGTPAVSDPGGRIVAAVAAAGLPVVVVPGPSALVAAVMGAGLDTARFAFLGFLPRSGKERERLILDAARAELALLLYEAPQRAQETLDDLFRLLGARPVVVARELTKLHETFHRGALGGALIPPLVERGEMVIVVGAGELKEQAVDTEALARDASLPPKERARRIAAALGISVRDAYARVEAARHSSEPSQDAAQDALDQLQHHLAEAARCLMLAERAAGSQAVGLAPPIPNDIAGADVLAALLASRPALRAPVEVHELARALLTSLAAADMLADALALEAGARPKPRSL
jgi:16S rRNA (cytidine1402-2'-O)-methyltransferase